MKNKIRGLLGLHGNSFADYARYLNITPQALQTKFKKKTYRVSDLIALAELIDCSLAFIDKNNKPIMIFTKEDVAKNQD